MTRLNARAVAVLVAAAVLLPAGAAHAALPLDTSTSASSVGSSSSAADEDSDDTGDDAVADDDGGTDDETVADDDSSSSSSSTDADDDSTDDDDSGAAVRSGGSAGSGSVTKGHTARAKKVAKPRGVDARLAAFDRAVVSFRPGSTGITRWIVTLRAGSSGRLLILGPKARSATFTALKASTRYTATVTAIGVGGKQASASDHVRTASLKKAVAQTRSEAARAVRESKAQRFG